MTIEVKAGAIVVAGWLYKEGQCQGCGKQSKATFCYECLKHQFDEEEGDPILKRDRERERERKGQPSLREQIKVAREVKAGAILGQDREVR